MFYKDKSEISSFALYNIPSYIKQEYPKFVRLVELFYEYMEQEGNVLYRLEHLEEDNSFMSPYNKFWDKIYQDAGFPFSDSLKIDKRQFFNYLMDFYLYRGSVRGMKFLISVLYDEECEVEYPREDMLIPSVAEYTYNQYIVCKLRQVDVNIFNKIKESINNFSLTVKSNSSDDALDVENVYTYLNNGEVYLNLKVNYKQYNKFSIGEQLTLYSDTFSIICTNTPLIKLNIKESGKQYKVDDVVRLSNTINNGLISVKNLTTGGIQRVNIINGGSGYVVGDYVYASKNLELTGGGFYAEVSEVDVNGAILKIDVFNSGQGYKQIPKIGVFSKTGSDSIIEGETDDIGGILSFDYIENYSMDLTNTKKSDVIYEILSDDGEGAILEIEPVVTNKTSSYYRTNTGFISNTSYLIDSLYYQQYCYKISSNIPRYIYDKAIDVMAHPSGYIRYAGFNIIDDYFVIDNKVSIMFYSEVTNLNGDVVIDSIGGDGNDSAYIATTKLISDEISDILGSNYVEALSNLDRNINVDNYVYSPLYIYKCDNIDSIYDMGNAYKIYDAYNKVEYVIKHLTNDGVVLDNDFDINFDFIYNVFDDGDVKVGVIKFIKYDDMSQYKKVIAWNDDSGNVDYMYDNDVIVIKVMEDITVNDEELLNDRFGDNKWIVEVV